MYTPLYRWGALAAFAVLLLMPLQMAVYVIWPPPDSLHEWFVLLRDQPVIGLLGLDLLLLLDYLLLGIVFLALWAALRRASASLAATALTFEMLAIASYMASTAAFEMLALSGAYASASTDAERATVLAAAQAVMAGWEGTAFTVSYIVSAIALLMISRAMRQDSRFSRITAFAGWATGLLSLVPANAGRVGLVFSLLALVPTAVWLAASARDLMRLAAVEEPS